MRFVIVVATICGCTDSYDHVKTAPSVCAFSSPDLALRNFVPEPQTFRAGEPLYFSFFAAADGCPPKIVGWCDAVIGLDHTIRVHAQIAWNGESPEQCARVIHGAGATCETAIPLADHSYRIVFEGSGQTLAVPSTTDQAVCVSR